MEIRAHWRQSGRGDQEHHNVGGLPKTMKFQLVEPLKRPVQG